MTDSKEGMSVGAFFVYVAVVIAGMFALAAMFGELGEQPTPTPAPSVTVSGSWVSWTP